ncbi:MAG TPA: S8 family peptidase [Flavisolibacter sp.]|nr:S8 family peptidase [Flavisolibacter sp.]
MKKLTLAFSLFTLAVLSACKKEINPETTVQNQSATTSANQTSRQGKEAYVANELLIRFKKGATQNGILNAITRINGTVKEHIITKAMLDTDHAEGLYLVNVPAGLQTALEKIKGMEEIDYAEPNYIYSIPEKILEADINDPLYSAPDNLWGMMGELTSPYKNLYASRAGEAWLDLSSTGGIITRGSSPQTGSRNVYVAVIDQGVEDNHIEFTRPDGSNQIATTYGKDFVNNDNDPSPNHSIEDHGTHVAGTIGAVGNNNFGVAGVNWEVSIISVRFLDHNGYGTAANAVKAIDYITELKKTGVNVIATNNSWGGLSSKALQASIERANQAGILFIAAAGNNNSDNDRRAVYPANYPSANIVSVASITPAGLKSNFSNWGAKTVDIAAPGSYIWSTVPVGSVDDATKDGKNDGIGWMSGTSMATPYVTGAAALYKSVFPSATAAEIKNALLMSARPTKAFTGKCVTGGRLDVKRAINNDYARLSAD